jgi:hypothetical protein
MQQIDHERPGDIVGAVPERLIRERPRRMLPDSEGPAERVEMAPVDRL